MHQTTTLRYAPRSTVRGIAQFWSPMLPLSAEIDEPVVERLGRALSA